MPMLLNWLDHPETKARMTERLLVYARNILVKESSGVYTITSEDKD